MKHKYNVWLNENEQLATSCEDLDRVYFNSFYLPLFNTIKTESMKHDSGTIINIVTAALVSCLVLHSCKGEDKSTLDNLALSNLNSTIKPPLQYADLERIDEHEDHSTNEEMYWIKYKAKVVAGDDLHVFTKRGWTGMDTFYVADNDSVFLKKIDDQIEFANSYNKTYGGGTQTRYTEIGEFRKGDSIKGAVKGVFFVKTKDGWRVRN